MCPNRARARWRRLASGLTILFLAGSMLGLPLAGHAPAGPPLRPGGPPGASGQTAGTYPIRLRAIGIPNGTPWSMAIGGTSYNFTNDSPTVDEPNGTYTYQLGSVNGWAPNGLGGAASSGTILVAGPPNGVVIPSLGVGFGSDPTGVVYVPNTTSLYVASSYYDSVLQVAVGTLPWRLEGNVSVGSLPSALAWDEANGTLWVANSASNNLTVLDPSSGQVVVPSLGVGSDPVALAADPRSGNLFVVNAGSDNVTVINGSSYRIVRSGVSVGRDPTAIAYDPSSGDLFVANSGTNTVSVLNGSTGTVVGNPIPVGTSPSGVAADPATGTIFVTNSGSSNLTVLNGSTRRVVVSGIAVGGGPTAPVYDPQDGDLYVPNQGTSNLTVIDPARERVVVPSIGTGPSPAAAAYVPTEGLIAVVSSAGNNLSAINGNGQLRFSFRTAPQYPVVWSANGLPAGTSWSVDFAGTTYRATGTTLTIPVSNGSFSYRLNPVIDYQPVGMPVDGVLTFAGGTYFAPSPSVGVTAWPNTGVYDNRTDRLYLSAFNPNNDNGTVSVVNATTFQPIGTIALPSGAVAMAFDPANGFIYLGYGFSAQVGVLNGSDNTWVTNFSVAPYFSFGSVSWITYDPYNQLLYASVTSGLISVFNGSTNPSILGTIPVGSTPVGSAVDPATHDLWVANSGSDNLSIVRLNGTNGTVEPYSPPSYHQPWAIVADPPLNRMLVTDGNHGRPGNLSVVSETDPNATWRYINPAGPYSLAVDSAGQALVVGQSADMLTLYSGNRLQINQSWSGITAYPSYVVYDPVAHAFLVANNLASNWTVLASHSTVPITWGPAPEYPVVFAETGLPNGTAWQVTFAGGTERTTNSTLRFSISVGVFPYRIQGPPGYRLTGGLSAGSVTVAAGPVNLAPSGVAVGAGPDAAAFDPSTGALYVANSFARNLTVVDPSTLHSVGRGIPVGGSPSAVAYDPVTGALLVANGPTNNLTVVDPVDGRTVANVAVQYAPSAIAYDPLIRSMIVADSGSDNLTIVNASTYRVTQNVSAGGTDPIAVAYNPTSRSLIVLDVGSARLVRLDATHLTLENNVSRFPAGATYPSGLAIDNLSGLVYVASDSGSPYGGGAFTVLNATLVPLLNVSLAGSPKGLAWDPAHGQLDLAEPSSGRVTVWGGNVTAGYQRVASVAVGVDPSGAVDVPTTREVVILNSGGRNLSVIGRGARIGTVWGPIPEYPVEFRAYGLPNGSRWTIDLNGTLYTTPNATMTIELPNGSFPYRYLPLAGERLLAPAAEGTLRVAGVPGGVLASGWAGGASPSAVAFDPQRGLLFVTDRANDSVTLLNASSGRVEGSVRVGAQPEAILDLAGPGLLVVANSGSDNLTVLNATSGALAGPPIAVGANPRALLWDPSAGLLVVADYGGSNLTLVNLTLGRSVGSLPVGLDPVGLALDPSTGYVFTVNAGSNNVTGVDPSAPTSPSINVPVGANPESIAFDPVTQQFWISDFGDGNLTRLNGSTPALAPMSRPIGAYPGRLTYDPVNGYLYLTLGVDHRVVAVDGVTGSVAASDLFPPAPVSFVTYLPGDGNLAAVNSTGGTVALINGLGPVTAVFAPYEYPVSFEATGLPPGGAFLLEFNGVPYPSNGPSLTLTVGNGSYAYQVAPISGWSATPSAGTVTVNGSAVRVVIGFVRVVYAVTLTEVGLPSGTAWSVEFNGTTASTTGPSLTWSVPNGSYPYRIVGVAGWATLGYAGTIPVNGSAVALTVPWTQVTYPVVVTVEGLPNGTVWTLLVNGRPVVSHNSTLTLDLPNGTYTLQVVAPPGYELRAPPGNLTLSGAAPSAPVVVGFAPTPPPPATAPVWPWWVLAAGGATVVGLLAWRITSRRRSKGRPPH